MTFLMNSPFLVFFISFFALWLSTYMGVFLRGKREKLNEEEREDFGVILTATLTLLGLIIGFTFSMAISRYDQRQHFEEQEANAIDNVHNRADLLPPADAAKVRALLVDYLRERILFYEDRNQSEIPQLDARTEQLQADIWDTVRTAVAAQQTPVLAMVLSSADGLLGSAGNTQAAWQNRIPIEAWALMGGIAICASLLIGYGMRTAKANSVLVIILVLIVSVSFFLIADIDSPRGGLIHIHPNNLTSLAKSLNR
ncbi:MAG TPA: hypothetical protein VK798_09875 [Alloacidobacterium sp.]|jgi:hypothetical protein|nr:hypothetical protein [Alloacidobacterium sp.]